MIMVQGLGLRDQGLGIKVRALDVVVVERRDVRSGIGDRHGKASWFGTMVRG